MHSRRHLHEASTPDLSNALTRAAEYAPANLSYVDDALVDFLRSRLRAQTAECIMATFGISANTWTKLKTGMPVRTSVAERLVERVARDTGQLGSPCSTRGVAAKATNSATNFMSRSQH